MVPQQSFSGRAFRFQIQRSVYELSGFQWSPGELNMKEPEASCPGVQRTRCSDFQIADGCFLLLFSVCVGGNPPEEPALLSVRSAIHQPLKIGLFSVVTMTIPEALREIAKHARYALIYEKPESLRDLPLTPVRANLCLETKMWTVWLKMEMTQTSREETKLRLHVRRVKVL